MACGEYGEGKMSEPLEILTKLEDYFKNSKINKKNASFSHCRSN